MSDNMVWLLGLMCLSFCISVWMIIRIIRRMDAEDAEASRLEKTTQLFPDVISMKELEQIMESRQLTLAQMAVNGNRLAYLYSLPWESQEKILDYLDGAAHCQHWAIVGYREQEFTYAAQFAQWAKERLQSAFDTLYPPRGKPR